MLSFCRPREAIADPAVQHISPSAQQGRNYLRSRVIRTGAEGANFPLLADLEDYFVSPASTCALGAFFASETKRLAFVDPSGDQPLDNYAVFTRYGKLVEDLLSSFLDSQNARLLHALFARRQFVSYALSGSIIDMAGH